MLRRTVSPPYRQLSARTVCVQRRRRRGPRLPRSPTIRWRTRSSESCSPQAAVCTRPSNPSPKVYTILAEAAYRQQKYDEARDYLKNAEQVEPDYAYALYIHSLVYTRLSMPREADRAFRQALALNPNVAAESNYVKNHNEYRSAGGNQAEDH